MKKIAVTALSVGLVTTLTGLSACTQKDDKQKTTVASTVASTVIQTASTTAPATASAAPTIAASTVVLKASAPDSAAPIVTPQTAAASATTATTTTATTTPAQASANARTPLQTDLITFLAAGKNLQQEAETKQAAMQKQLQAKAKDAKTPEAQQKLQQQLITDVVAFKTQQKQQLQSIALTEPRVKAVRDKMVESLDNDIKASQIVIKNPQPTPETQKSFTNTMKKAQDANMQASEQLHKLLQEAGMANDTPTAKGKK